MGCASSKANFIPEANGDEKAYKERYTEDRVLGAGEFGTVKLVKDNINPNAEALASKELKKGVVFKDNTLYAPMKPEILQQELQILRTLNGEHYNLKLSGVFESSSTIYMITEFCGGGELMDYVANTMKEGIRTEDASRIGYQILDAMNHCAKHNIMHRDLKSENIMFREAKPGSDLRIIDYGSGTIDPPLEQTGGEPKVHKTMAGTAFYIAPEVFQQKYTNKADVWSVGVVLYVLVAGYPADDLQKAYNRLHKSKRDLKTLPNMPQDMPDSYYEMLEDLLTYKPAKRKTAAQVLECDFITFHKELEEEIKKLSSKRPSAGRMSIRRTSSIVINGSSDRHEAYIGFRKFEMAVTTLMATLLSPDRYADLLKAVEKKLEGPALPDMTAIAEDEEESEENDTEEEPEENDTEEDEVEVVARRSSIMAEQKKTLNVLMVNELKDLLSDLGHTEIIEKIEGLNNADQYNTYSYHVKMLRQFSGSGNSNKQDNNTTSNPVANGNGPRAASRMGRMTKTMSVVLGKGAPLGSKHSSFMDDSTHSIGSAGSGGVSASRPGRLSKMKSLMV